MAKTLVQKIAGLVLAIENCRKSNNSEWLQKHADNLDALVKNEMPRGSGIDCGTKFLSDVSTAEKLVFTCDFHHMDGDGFYDGWTHHKITARPSFAFGVNLTITGPNKREIKDYLYQVYFDALTTAAE